MIYLIYYNNVCKYFNVPPQSTTIIIKHTPKKENSSQGGGEICLCQQDRTCVFSMKGEGYNALLDV
jgi:hypothetical protein